MKAYKEQSEHDYSDKTGADHDEKRSLPAGKTVLLKADGAQDQGDEENRAD